MKKLIIAMAAIAIVAGVAQAQGIASSAHDFSTGFSWNTTGQICIVCHTPHGSATTPKPLWNHASSTANYTEYGTTLLGSAAGDPLGSSLVCLSCHDGTVGLGNFGGTTGNTDYVGGAFLVGTVLTDDHPISVTYNVSNGLRATTTELRTGLTIAQALESNQVQCATCHNVHNESGVDKLLHSTNAASALCLKCHIK